MTKIQRTNTKYNYKSRICSWLSIIKMIYLAWDTRTEIELNLRKKKQGKGFVAKKR